MWIATRVLPHRTRLIVGCGSNHDHAGVHAQADTLDIDAYSNPDIVGNIVDPITDPSFFGKYRFILCECLPVPLYNNQALYRNLAFLRAHDSTILFLSLPGLAPQRVEQGCSARGWSVRNLTEFGEFPPHLRIDDDFARHLQILIAMSPYPSLLVE
jgi:hypothetical protein